MKEFDYKLDYKQINFKKPENRELYRIGRGEQGVLLVRPYTDTICRHWKFKTPDKARKSSKKIYEMFETYKRKGDFIGMDMCRKFLEMGFTRARRYANHKDGKKYNPDRTIKPQEPDALTSDKALSAKIFKNIRDLAAYDETYQIMRKQWRESENAV
tara:strand:- start:413 stop:883 length:471 start_codon:yes stop_codon:yes gene_type:complete